MADDDSVLTEIQSDFEPDEVLAEVLPIIPVGRALDLGMGEGEHALWLAAHGFTVEGIDRDPPALHRAQERAHRLGLTIQTVQADIVDFASPPGVYSLILATAALHFLRPSQLADLAPRLTRSLTPGGYLYATVLTTDDPGYRALLAADVPLIEPNTFDLSDEDAPDLRHYFAPGELRALFPALTVVHDIEERYLRPDSDQGYNAAAVLLARRD